MSEAPSQQQIAAELLRRQRARSSIAEFSQSITIPGVPVGEEPEDEVDSVTGKLLAPVDKTPTYFTPIESRVALHHLVMMNHIQRCIETDRGRAMIFAPPGSAKSTYGSVVAPAWAMGKWPGFQTILASYATGIAVKQSRKVRAICTDPAYSSLWPGNPTIREDQRAVDDWSMTNSSSMMAAGLLAGITGNRADFIPIDDPIANREQADSAQIREKIYQEYIDTAMTRLKPKGSALIIQTRWHEEDLSGAILPLDYNGESGLIKCRDGQVWDVLCLQAECERADDPLGRKIGEFIWPEWFSKEHWSTWRDNPRAARTWAALYQQRPAPFSGIHFNREMFNWFDPDLVRGST